MQALEVIRSPLTVCVEHLQQSAGPAASSDNVGALSAKLATGQSTLQACAQIILRDLGLTLRLLRIANSALFNPGGKTVTSVTHAAALLGTDALSQIVDTVPRHTLGHPARELVVLSHLTALLARTLVSRIEPRYAEEAFICGLVRNVGELTYALERPDDYQRVLGGSHGHLMGLRASSQMHSHFDFDELSAGLLHHWAFYGPPVLAAQSTPEALFAQHGNPDVEIALAATLAHNIAVTYLRAESGEREKLMRNSWGPLVKLYQMREAQVESLCASMYENADRFLNRMNVTRDGLRFRNWVPENPAVAAAAPLVDVPGEVTMTEVLRMAIAKGVDRAAWLPYNEPDVQLGASVGDGWPATGASVLPSLLQPRKPPFLLAFGQRQDVWIDLGKDNRFRESSLAKTMQPAAFFLLPVCEGRKVRGCLYFDIVTKREQAPEVVMPALSAVRDFVTSHMSVL